MVYDYCTLGGEKSYELYDSYLIGIGAVQCYECIACLGCNKTAFGIGLGQNTDCFYMLNGNSCQNCFGCEGLERKQYCILNKQYSQEEYEKLVPKIIEHMKKTPYPSVNSGSVGTEWGEFFPTAISPFAYNETVAQEYYPLSKRRVNKQGWKWQEYHEEAPRVEKTITANQLTDKISDTPDDILNWAIRCLISQKLFRITSTELTFYREMRVPIPRFHPDMRYQERLKRKNPYQLWDRECAKCHKDIHSSYSPERPEKVFCEVCYLKEVY